MLNKTDQLKVDATESAVLEKKSPVSETQSLIQIKAIYQAFFTVL